MTTTKPTAESANVGFTVPSPAATSGSQQPKTARWRDWLLAGSLANVMFFQYWHQVLYAHDVFIPSWTWRDLLALFLYVSILALFFRALILIGKTKLLRRFGPHRFLFLLTPLIFIYILWLKYMGQINRHFGAEVVDASAVIIFLLFCWAVYRWHAPMLRVTELVTLWLFAFVPMTFGQAAWLMTQAPPAPVLVPFFEQQILPHRVVVIIFDEFDWTYGFGNRPEGLDLPAFDRMREESFSSEVTYQSAQTTLRAIPAMLMGRQLRETRRTLEGVEAEESANETLEKFSVLQAARKAGVNVGIVGWYLPYCTIFQTTASSCFTDNPAIRPFPKGKLKTVLDRVQFFFEVEDRKRHIDRHHAQVEHARRLLRDERVGLAFIHIALPHLPAIYDRKKQNFTLWQSNPEEGYLGNMVLADRLLATLRQTMEEAGTWDDSHVIVTSDHFFRTATGGRRDEESAIFDRLLNGRDGEHYDQDRERRVPFFVKLADTRERTRYEKIESNIMLHDLVLDLVQQKIKTTQDMHSFMHHHQLSEVPTRF
jgi:hypothetical protein